ncbi:hypothetical protein H074_18683 [Amycolatopsis decaplanina DSM 44594]|uniref:LTD domain-containing protein n=1 Tax=Amycolatopsis decaplanina DSM 44594 TaxID=1284240 RepID=M2ZE66_9PSEU|nr:hypothetical protein H074_18683 [Amycolatopsis decaplanina DSM 44594]
MVAVITAVIGLAAGGAGNAAEADRHVQGAQPTFETHLHEIGTRGAYDSHAEFVEIANRGPRVLPLGGYRVLATLHSHAVELARIPDDALLRPGAVYLLASARFVGGPPPDQIFSIAEDIPEVFTMTLVTPRGEAVDVVTTVRTLPPCGSPAPRPPNGLCLKRVRFTGDNSKDWAVARCTPGVY